jgi:drug/metabolite transporter (DMT)-like permease
MVSAVLTAVLFANSVILGHRAAKLAGSLEANFWRVILATIFLAFWAFTFGAGFSGAGFVWFIMSGAIGVGLGDFAFYHALPKLGPRISSLVGQCMMAVFGVLFDWLWLGTHISGEQIVLSFITLSGVAIALGTMSEIREHARTLRPGLALASFGAAATAAGALLSSKAFKVIHSEGASLDGITAGFQRMVGGLSVSLLVYVALRFSKGSSKDPLFAIATPERKRAWLWIIGNALAGQTLGVSAMQWALSTIPASQVLVVVATAPILVIPLARIFNGERITVRAVVGSLIAVGGVIGLILLK